MHIIIRQYQVMVDHMDDVVQAIRDGFVPRLQAIPGFAAYDLLVMGDQLATVSTFETAEGAAASTQLATAFIQERPDLAAFIPTRTVTEGEVRLHLAADRLAGAAYSR